MTPALAPLTAENPADASTDVERPHTLTDDEKAQILALRATEHSISAIARKIDRHWRTVAGYVHETDELTEELAGKLLAAGGLQQLENWERAAQLAALKGDHRPAKEWLTHARLVKPVESAGNSAHVGVQVVIGMPGAPAGPDPLMVTTRPDAGLSPVAINDLACGKVG